jgi:hypothetical protein
MTAKQPKYAPEEFARRGDAIYESVVAPNLKPDDVGKYVAIDIDTEAFEIDAQELLACDRLSEKLPGAQIWLVRAGSPFLYRFGSSRRLPS